MKRFYWLLILSALAGVLMSFSWKSPLEAAENYSFMHSKNLKRKQRKSYAALVDFYGDYYVPHKVRQMNAGSPPYTPHRMDGDFKDCTSCHELERYKDQYYSGVRIPPHPKWMPTRLKAKHPRAPGSCMMCHIYQATRHQFSEFYLKEVFSKKYMPKL
jgi:hypothetical protein